MSTPNTIAALLEQAVSQLEHESSRYTAEGGDRPVTLSGGRLTQSIGSLHLYQFSLPTDSALAVDIPVTIVPSDEGEPTEGHVLQCNEAGVYVQTFDPLGDTLSTVTLVPDGSGFLALGAQRLTEMAQKTDLYTLGPAERMIPLFEASQAGDRAAIQNMTSTSVLTTLWQDDITARRQRISTMALDLIRGNKRILLVSPDHHSADVVTGVIARAMKGAGLTYKSWLTRYELAIEKEVAGVHLQELGFEAQMHQFYAKSRADKASLRRTYERFRELTPLLAYKAQKQRDLDEVRLLEWRLLTHLSEVQATIKTIDTTLMEYETLPLWKRLSMQAVGKNVESLRQYREIHEDRIAGLKSELDIAKQRIDQLVPEAAVPKEVRPEFQELKEDIQRLGGTKKIREMLAAAEDTNRQAFVQNRRVLITTAARVLTDPLFRRVRFDILIVDEAPRVSSAFLIAAAGLVRERIILSGDAREIRSDGPWSPARDLLLPGDAPVPTAS